MRVERKIRGLKDEITQLCEQHKLPLPRTVCVMKNYAGRPEKHFVRICVQKGSEIFDLSIRIQKYVGDELEKIDKFELREYLQKSIRVLCGEEPTLKQEKMRQMVYLI